MLKDNASQLSLKVCGGLDMFLVASVLGLNQYFPAQ
jgi:hypothetical protein